MKLVTGSRIHINSIDMNGEIGRCCGDIGLAIEKPKFEIELKPNKRSKSVKEVKEIYSALKHHFILKHKNYSLKIILRIPAHKGLGSKTILYMSIARLMANINGYSYIPDIELGKIIQAGGYSGVGIGTIINKGGFILSSGYSFGLGKSKYKFNEYSKKPPVIFPKIEFPKKWNIVLAIPKNFHGKNGKTEQDFFKKITPVPKNDTEKISHIILMKLIPAIYEKDFYNFMESMNEICKYGTKPYEKELNKRSHSMLKMLEKENGFGGLTSVGTACYTITDSFEKAQKIASKINQSKNFYSIITKANNTGYEVF